MDLVIKYLYSIHFYQSSLFVSVIEMVINLVPFSLSLTSDICSALEYRGHAVFPLLRKPFAQITSQLGATPLHQVASLHKGLLSLSHLRSLSIPVPRFIFFLALNHCSTYYSTTELPSVFNIVFLFFSAELNLFKST